MSVRVQAPVRRDTRGTVEESVTNSPQERKASEQTRSQGRQPRVRVDSRGFGRNSRRTERLVCGDKAAPVLSIALEHNSLARQDRRLHGIHTGKLPSCVQRHQRPETVRGRGDTGLSVGQATRGGSRSCGGSAYLEAVEAISECLPLEIAKRVVHFTMLYPDHCKEYVARVQKVVGPCLFTLTHVHHHAYKFGSAITPSFGSHPHYFELRKCKMCDSPISVSWIRHVPGGGFKLALIRSETKRPSIGTCGTCIHEYFVLKTHGTYGKINLMTTN